MSFLSVSVNLLQDAYIIFQKSADNFEIVHKTFRFEVQFPLNIIKIIKKWSTYHMNRKLIDIYVFLEDTDPQRHEYWLWLHNASCHDIVLVYLHTQYLIGNLRGNKHKQTINVEKTMHKHLTLLI